MIITAIKIICIILAIVLIVLVILQQGKGSDLGSAFGGGSSNSMFGAVGPSNFLGKLTAFIAALFLILNLAQAVLLKNANTEVLFTNEEIQEMHSAIRKNVKKQYDSSVSKNVSILYGGSVKSINAKEIFDLEDVDGGLIGGASLDAREFIDIVNSIS